MRYFTASIVLGVGLFLTFGTASAQHHGGSHHGGHQVQGSYYVHGGHGHVYHGHGHAQGNFNQTYVNVQSHSIPYYGGYTQGYVAPPIGIYAGTTYGHSHYANHHAHRRHHHH